jgi:hypothetical protein
MRGFGLPEMLVIFGLCVMIPLAALIFGFLVRRLRAQERLRTIEKGLPIPQEDPWERAARIRRAGISAVAAGLGLFIFLVLQHEGPNVGIAAIPILMGLGFLYDYRLTVRDLRARQAFRASGDTPRQQ